MHFMVERTGKLYKNLYIYLYLSGLTCSLLLPVYAIAGGSPETTLVVVNSDSQLSRRIANEYVYLRNIPENHIVWLDGVPSMDTISIKDFRKKIWSPIKDFILSHKLSEEIDVITYSGDFPYAVNFSADLKAKSLKKDKYRGTIASLTSMTYFARRVAVEDIGYLGENYYFRDFAGPRIKALSKHPAAFPRLDKKDIRRLKNTARKNLNHKNSAAAEKNYQTILDNYPDNPENWYNLARSQAAAQMPDKVIESLTTAVDYGWSNSLRTSRDQYFKSLHPKPEFQELLVRMETAYGPFLATNGFRNHYVWSNADLLFWEPGDALNQYYLSTMLAYTGVRGNSFPEIMNYLAAAASSDASQPDGTVYLLENSNIRSQTRQPLFTATLAELGRRKRKGEVLYKGADNQNGINPIARTDVIGAVVGFPEYKWDTNSLLLPGAIAESLTSYGGHFNKAKQTKLTEFLRHGAAGSSGAVAEPFSFQEKFPVPLIHAWYADGCSLAESFYQSIRVPYQLIIVGDPLTRPFASFANIKLKSPQLMSPWSKIVKIEAEVHPAQGKAISKMEFWVDGQYQFDVPVDKPFLWDTQTVEDGSHEIRLVSIEDTHIETRSSVSFIAQVFNNHHRIYIDYISPIRTYQDTIKISGTAPGAEKVEVFRGDSILGTATVNDSQWQISIPARIFGIGPVSFFVKAVNQDGSTVRSEPIQLSIGMPEGLQPVLHKKPSGNGLSAIVYDKEDKEHHLLIKQLNGPLRELRKNKLTARKLRLDGYFYVDSDGFYQLAIAARGHLRVSVNDQMLLDKQLSKHDGNTFLSLNLKQGWHQLRFDFEVSGRPYLKVVLAGEQVPAILSGDRLGHAITVQNFQPDL